MKTQLFLLLIFLLVCVIIIFNLSTTSSNTSRARHNVITLSNDIDDDQSSNIILDATPDDPAQRDQVSPPSARLQTSPHYFRDLTKQLRKTHKKIPLLPFEKPSVIADGAFKLHRGSNDHVDTYFAVSEKIHPRASSNNNDNNNNNRLNVVVIGTGAMLSWERCAPRLRSSLLEPNNAFLTLFTFPGFLSEDYLNTNYETFYDPVVNLDGESARRRRTKKPSSKNGNNNNNNNPKVSLDLIPRYSNEQHHEKLLKVYGEKHLALSVLLNSSKFIQLAKKKAPKVTFYHYLTVLAQWAVIEYSAAKTMSLLSAISKKTGSQHDYIFVRIRPDIFIVGTKIIFSISNHKDDKKIFRITMACGGEKNVPVRRENKTTSNNYEFTVPIADLLKSPTFFRTTPFPEQEWPHDPLSDFSSVFVVLSKSQSSGSDGNGQDDDKVDEKININNNNSFDSLIASSVIARGGFRLWSWMISQPEKKNYLDIDGYSYISPETVTTNFTTLTGLKTKKIPFGWHFLLRQEMYMKVNRPKPKIEKGLRMLFKKVFKTDDPDTVGCPSSL